MTHTAQKQRKFNVVRTGHYNCAYVRLMAVLIIFPVFLQTVINLIMLFIGGHCILPGKAIPEMTYTVSGWTLNPTYSLTHSVLTYGRYL